MRMKDQFGNITLFNADCMDILRDMADNSFDLAFPSLCSALIAIMLYEDEKCDYILRRIRELKQKRK